MWEVLNYRILVSSKEGQECKFGYEEIAAFLKDGFTDSLNLHQAKILDLYPFKYSTREHGNRVYRMIFTDSAELARILWMAYNSVNCTGF